MYNYFMKYFRKRAIQIGMKIGVDLLLGNLNPADSPWGPPGESSPKLWRNESDSHDVWENSLGMISGIRQSLVMAAVDGLSRTLTALGITEKWRSWPKAPSPSKSSLRGPSSELICTEAARVYLTSFRSRCVPR
jgi:hypothetical protein